MNSLLNVKSVLKAGAAAGLIAALCSCQPSASNRFRPVKGLARKMLSVLNEFCPSCRKMTADDRMTHRVAGYYVSEVTEGSGAELYLLDNGMYVYAEWSESRPLTLSDRGNWHKEADMLLLQPSDPEIAASEDLKYLPVIRLSEKGKKEILLFGYPGYFTFYSNDLSREPEAVKAAIGETLPGIFKQEAAIAAGTAEELLSRRFPGFESGRTTP